MKSGKNAILSRFYQLIDNEIIITPDHEFHLKYKSNVEMFYNQYCKPHRDKKIVIDLSNINHLDSMMIGMLIEFARTCKLNKHDHSCRVLDYKIRKIISLTKLTNYLNVEE